MAMSCACGCNPCVCASSARRGCLADLNPLRPTFFSGQLVTADDLNAIMTYFQAKNALLAKLVAGWGVLGGLRLAAPGTASYHLFDNKISEGDEPSTCLHSVVPNPQIIAGSVVRVTAGAAIDNAGNTMSLLAPTSMDIVSASQGLDGRMETKTPAEWFGDFMRSLPDHFTATQYWVVAQHIETPTRPVPQLTGAACGASCDFSRVLDDVSIRLVKDLPLLYFLHGCLDNIPIPCFEELVSLAVGTLEMTPDFITNLQSALADSNTIQMLVAHANGATAKTANYGAAEIFGCLGFKFIPQLVEFINNIAIDTCCSRPAVVLGRVLLADDVPEEVKVALGTKDKNTKYLIIDDAFPYRRIVPNAAMHKMLATALVSLLTCLTESTART